jgi:hypothetical protein
MVVGMRSPLLIAFLWLWALWSVGASIEFLAGVPAAAAGVSLGVLVAVVILIREHSGVLGVARPARTVPAAREGSLSPKG